MKNIVERAIKTVCQTAVSMLTVGQAVIDVDWMNVISISLMAGIISVLTTVATYGDEDGE